MLDSTHSKIIKTVVKRPFWPRVVEPIFLVLCSSSLADGIVQWWKGVSKAMSVRYLSLSLADAASASNIKVYRKQVLHEDNTMLFQFRDVEVVVFQT